MGREAYEVSVSASYLGFCLVCLVPLFGRNIAVRIRHTDINSIIDESNFMGVKVYKWKWVQSKWEIKNEMSEMRTQDYRA